jgi:hypothetical protein
MARSTAAISLADRMCRPQRIGVFGHRGVGKTTLLTMLYREAVGGRLPGLRLAAADARTADYLADKVLQLEAGQRLPATLAETDLALHLYHGDTRLELLVKDYQGEHIERGRHGPVREFLAECDAVWLCLDVGTVPEPAERLRRQQEIEQLIEDYLVAEPHRTMERPIALLLTKSDLLGPEPADIDALADAHFGMTRHALRSHCPHNGLIAVSSLGAGVRSQESEEAIQANSSAIPPLSPMNLAEPLTWLAATLQLQDEARLERLWALDGKQGTLLDRCVKCFIHRYPQAAAATLHSQRLRELRRRRRRRRAFTGIAAAACLVLGLWTYDAVGYRSASRFETDHAADPTAVLATWQEYQATHPTRSLSGSDVTEDHLKEIAHAARQQECDARLAELRHQAADPDADPEKLWHQFQDFRGRFPEVNVTGDLEQLRTNLQSRRDDQRRHAAQRAFDALMRHSQRPTDLMAVVTEADRFLRDFADTGLEEEVRRCRTACLLRLDEQDIHAAREYSARQPLNFQTRRELYQRYLDRHPGGGACTEEAKAALRAIDRDWDKHDFRALRDQFVAHPGDVAETVSHCRRYLAVHPHGKFRGPAEEVLRWTERVTAAGEYKVTLKSGSFDPKLAYWISRGLKLSIEIEVAGVRHGPSTIVKNSSEPEWNYEFPRKVRWKLGDPVRILVSDHTWKDRVVVEIASGDDPLALRLLSGEAASGPNRVTFESEFVMPKLPAIE